MRRYHWILLVGALWLGGLTACAPSIGDACHTDRDCAGVEARTCDTSSPGGYCTIIPCEHSDCPDASVCVNFGEVKACMRRCDQHDCSRGDEGYICRSDIGPVPFCYLPPDDDPHAD